MGGKIMKRLMAVTILCLFGLTSIALAEEGDMQRKGHKGDQQKAVSSSSTPGDAKVVNAGNKTCPISGNPVNGTDYVVYKGKRYGICCKGCDEQFLKNPEKYIKALKAKGEIK